MFTVFIVNNIYSLKTTRLTELELKPLWGKWSTLRITVHKYTVLSRLPTEMSCPTYSFKPATFWLSGKS